MWHFQSGFIDGWPKSMLYLNQPVSVSVYTTVNLKKKSLMVVELLQFYCDTNFNIFYWWMPLKVYKLLWM